MAANSSSSASSFVLFSEGWGGGGYRFVLRRAGSLTCSTDAYWFAGSCSSSSVALGSLDVAFVAGADHRQRLHHHRLQRRQTARQSNAKRNRSAWRKKSLHSTPSSAFIVSRSISRKRGQPKRTDGVDSRWHGIFRTIYSMMLANVDFCPNFQSQVLLFFVFFAPPFDDGLNSLAD